MPPVRPNQRRDNFRIVGYRNQPRPTTGSEQRASEEFQYGLGQPIAPSSSMGVFAITDSGSRALKRVRGPRREVVTRAENVSDPKPDSPRQSAGRAAEDVASSEAVPNDQSSASTRPEPDRRADQMAPRKSNASAGTADGDKELGISVEDLNLPRTMVQRLAKGVLPANTQIQKDALLAISKSATVFVNYLASHANENAQRLNKKTIQPKDVLDALADIEFASFGARCEGELQKYNAVQCDKRNTYRRRIKEEAKAKEVTMTGATGGATNALFQSGDAGAGGENGPNASARDLQTGLLVHGDSWWDSSKATARAKDLQEVPSSKRAKGEDGAARDVMDDEDDSMDDDEAEDDEDEEDPPDDQEEDNEVEEYTYEDAEADRQERGHHEFLDGRLEEGGMEGRDVPQHDSEADSSDDAVRVDEKWRDIY